ncbi:hypothetical protein EDB84DRAFT_1494780 [Lactarius hengduanensis]|nr:hypothetical protein EDB84DRAFT_1494780 [Lactarius hengduanensis]
MLARGWRSSTRSRAETGRSVPVPALANRSSTYKTRKTWSPAPTFSRRQIYRQGCSAKKSIYRSNPFGSCLRSAERESSCIAADICATERPRGGSACERTTPVHVLNSLDSLACHSPTVCILEKTRPRTLHYHTQLRRRGRPWRSAFPAPVMLTVKHAFLPSSLRSRRSSSMCFHVNWNLMDDLKSLRSHGQSLMYTRITFWYCPVLEVLSVPHRGQTLSVLCP